MVIGRPHTTLCMAMSLDGKIASVDGTGARFSSRADKQRLLSLRTRTDAILVGSHTISVDNDRMRAWTAEAQQERLQQGLSPQPLCAIVSTRGRFPLNAAVLQDPGGRVLLFTTEQIPSERRETLATQIQIRTLGQKRVDLERALQLLATEYGVRKVLVEGGGELNAALFEKGLIDEIYLTLCPMILGGRTAPTIAGGEGFSLQDMKRYVLVEARPVEDEMFLHYARVGSS